MAARGAGRRLSPSRCWPATAGDAPSRPGWTSNPNAGHARTPTPVPTGRRAGGAQTAGVYPAGRLMVFFSRNSSSPSSPNSRPTPEALYPPKGEEKSMGMLELTM